MQSELRLWATGATVAGLDEAGAGPLAGPVTAACVVLNPDTVDELVGVYDSKALSPARRTALAERVKTYALAWSVENGTVAEIEAINIRQAGLLAMRRALEAVTATLEVHHLLVDARTVPGTDIEQTSIIRGDAKSLSIAAASILAKVDRDAQMEALDATFPGYGFAQHRGYGTKQHLDALKTLGPCPAHRPSFEPIRSMLRQPKLPL